MSRQNTNALALSWTIGFNKDIIGGVHSLADEYRHAMFYISAHMGVIYDYSTRTQKLLQGHCNAITCCTVSEDKRWIITADSGNDCILVVWDSHSGIPIKTLFKPHLSGVISVDISPDSMFLVTLSNKIEGNQQEISLWEWTIDKTTALYTSKIATPDKQICVKFNSYDIREIITNGKKRVIFWNWQRRTLEFYSPTISQKDFKQIISDFTYSIFLPDSRKAITGTVNGEIILWDESLIGKDSSFDSNTIEKRAIKFIPITETDSTPKISINCISIIDRYLAIGTSDGAVRFYDYHFRLIAWFEDLQAGSVTSISFANTFPLETKLEEKESYSSLLSFFVPEFIVGTKNGFIIGLDSEIFKETQAEKRRGTLLVQGLQDSILGLSAHPLLHQLALCCSSGTVQIWDYESRRLIRMRNFNDNNLYPQSLSYCTNGKCLAVGYSNGVLKLLNSINLEDQSTFRQSKNSILLIKFSPDSLFLATADNDFHVALWTCTEDNNKNSNNINSTKSLSIDSSKDLWIYLGRHKSHHASIISLEFSISKEKLPLLISVGEDRKLVEYCLSKTSIANGVVLIDQPIDIEETAIPSTCFWQSSKEEDLIVIINNEYKIKQWIASTKEYFSTSLGPTYGGPLNRVLNFPSPFDHLELLDKEKEEFFQEKYCAYSTKERVVGLIKLPFDGNPNKCMGLIAHPGELSNIALTYDAKYLITSGGKDLSVNMWEIDTKALDLLEASGGLGIESYLSLIEGGLEGEFYKEIKDYFYYCQLRTQGEYSTKERIVNGEIPLKEIPYMMRALGYYPTEKEIQHINKEILNKKYFTDKERLKNKEEIIRKEEDSNYNKSNKKQEKSNYTIDFNEFIQLYINYRPVFGISKQHIEDAFKILSLEEKIDWNSLKEMLQTTGEVMSEDEIKECLKSLTGEEIVKEQVDASYFAEEILGFEDPEE